MCCQKEKDLPKWISPSHGASDEARTRYLHLGKVALYQMSYTRGDKKYYSKYSENVKREFQKNQKFSRASGNRLFSAQGHGGAVPSVAMLGHVAVRAEGSFSIGQ